jgi:hypothetical protein
MFFYQNKVIFAGILVPMLVGSAVFRREGRTPFGVRIEDVQGGRAQAKGKYRRRDPAEICGTQFREPEFAQDRFPARPVFDDRLVAGGRRPA